MTTNFLKHTVTDSVRKAQEHYFGSSPRIAGTPEQDALTEDEIAFVQAHDSFYMATVIERLFFIEVLSFDWNRPKYITPRYTAEEIQELVGPLKQRISPEASREKSGRLHLPRFARLSRFSTNVPTELHKLWDSRLKRMNQEQAP